MCTVKLETIRQKKKKSKQKIENSLKHKCMSDLALENTPEPALEVTLTQR